MSGHVIGNEFAKMRHLHTSLIAAAMTAAGLMLALFTVASSPETSVETPAVWDALLAGLSLGIPLVSPLLLAVMASRLVDIEHQGNGWLLQSTAAITPGAVCRAKTAALGLIVTASTIVTGILTVLVGKLLVGITAPIPLGRFTVFIGAMVIVNLALLALHVLISAKVDNQLVALGIGAFGCVAAVFSQGLPAAIAHITPWGYYALAKAADYQADGFVPQAVSVPSIAVLAIIVGAIFTVITHRFDRQEA